MMKTYLQYRDRFKRQPMCIAAKEDIAGAGDKPTPRRDILTHLYTKHTSSRTYRLKRSSWSLVVHRHHFHRKEPP